MIDRRTPHPPDPSGTGQGPGVGFGAGSRFPRLVIVVAALLSVAAVLPSHSQHPLRATGATLLAVALSIALVLWRYRRHPDLSYQGVIEGALRLAAWSTLVIVGVGAIVTALGVLLAS